MIGQTLSQYRITAALGAGGMGEVYRATDAKLGREVAIKVLPAELAGDPERLARFEREARLLAALSHSSIAHVYDFERSTLPDGSSVHFIAMELVRGEDLAERRKRGRCQSTRRSPSQGRSPRPSRRPTRRGSFTGTSSRRT
jgi:serine/threonine protein kinase